MMEYTRTLGLDVGDKRIGIAISDPFGLVAQPVRTLFRSDLETDFLEIANLVQAQRVSCVIVGFPKNMDGTVGFQGEAVMTFAQQLKKYLTDTVELVFWDERLSSKSAERVLIEGNVSRKKRKNVIDQMAAVIILQNYLDSRKFVR